MPDLEKIIFWMNFPDSGNPVHPKIQPVYSEALKNPSCFIPEAPENHFVSLPSNDVVVVVVVLLFYVHGKHLRSCQDGQLT